MNRNLCNTRNPRPESCPAIFLFHKSPDKREKDTFLLLLRSHSLHLWVQKSQFPPELVKRLVNSTTWNKEITSRSDMGTLQCRHLKQEGCQFWPRQVKNRPNPSVRWQPAQVDIPADLTVQQNPCHPVCKGLTPGAMKPLSTKMTMKRSLTLVQGP